jgi:PAS domain S-box-containing protein
MPSGNEATSLTGLGRRLKLRARQGRKLELARELSAKRAEVEEYQELLSRLANLGSATLSGAVEALRQGNERYQRLLESITSYVYTVFMEDGRPGRTVHGPGCESVTGYAAEAFDQNPYLWLEMIHSEDQEGVAAGVQAILAERRPKSFEHRLLHRDGTLRWVRNTLVPHLDAEGRLVSYDGVVQDITERRRSEEERHRLESQLAQAQRLESLGILAGGVAHDINNVLAAILGLASLNHEHTAPPGFLAQSMETIATACMRGREVVKGLLYLARKDLNTTGPVDLNRLVRDLRLLLEATTLKQVHLRTELEEPLEPVQGDAGAISHALMNLCVNAVDAMPGGGSLTLRTCRTASDRVEVRVTDTGEGMSPEVLKRAADPFFTTKALGKGTGMGLAMVYGAMKAHGGTLEIRSEVGQGTEVVLGFPLQPAAARPGEGCAQPDPAAARTGPAPMRILMVDDDELIRASIPTLLEALGHQVATAAGGQEALALLASGMATDLVILDMRMPDLSGAETLPRLRALRPDLPVLLATGHSDRDLPALLERHPRVSWIQKPFTMAEIRDKLGEFAPPAP